MTRQTQSTVDGKQVQGDEPPAVVTWTVPLSWFAVASGQFDRPPEPEPDEPLTIERR